MPNLRRSKTPGQVARRRLARPAFESACLVTRPDGRQLVISRGANPKPDAEPTNTERRHSDAGESPQKRERSKRGRITGFSENSRRRLRRTVHAIRRNAPCVFATLTYHQTTPPPGDAQTSLDRFVKRLRRRFPHISAVWKKEPQERGTPHYHLLIYGIRWINAQWLSRQWHECTDETSDAHRKSGVDVEWVRNDGKLQSYLAKYFTKVLGAWPKTGDPETDAAWEYPGRFWGVYNRENLPVAEWARLEDYGAVELSSEHAAFLIRTLLDQWGVDTGGVIPPSLTVNTRGDPAKVAEKLLSLIPA